MKITRRSFIKGASALGVISALGGVSQVFASGKKVPEYIAGAPLKDALADEEGVEIKYSVCLQCHSACTIRVKVENGVIRKIDGNPYSPMTMDPPIPYDTPPEEAKKYVGRVCARGQAGIQTCYDPYRVTQPLKRVGPRGSGKWQPISWEQALTEIVEGGDLFGEGHVDGLRAIRDLETPIDPGAPELGPKANQFVFLAGRIEHGRKEFSKRFVKDAFGSVNWFEHTSICEQSHHIAFKQTMGGKSHFKPDFDHAQYIISFGATYGEANFPMNALGRKLADFKLRGGKLVVVDPRMSNTAVKADRWVPIKPGMDGALAMGMIRWIIDHERYDKRFLQNTSKEAAAKDGESSWTDATYLVRLDNMSLLRAGDAGLGGSPNAYVVLSDGEPQVYTQVDHGDLEGEIVINGIRCKTVFTLLKERAREYSLAEYAKFAGVEADLIATLADEFSAHGKRAVADFYRGPVQHTNGFYNGRAIIVLNLLVGNIDHKGGYAVGGGHLHEMGGKPGNPYDLAKMHPGKVKAKGVPISREKSRYEDSTEFKKNGYPAKRPWFPFSGNIYQEVMAGIADQYPYPIKALFLHMGTPAYSTPAMKDIIINTLKDTRKVPLFVACDILIGETSMYADYILPDVTYLERWGTPHTAPTILTTVSKVRQPVVKVHPETRSLEEILIDLAKRLNLPGFGKDGFGPGLDLEKPEDWYLKMVANYAYGDKPGDAVPGATEKEKIQYVLDRGGRFEPVDQAYDGDLLKHRYGKLCTIYAEKVAQAKHSITGEPFDGLPRFEPIKDMKGNLITDDDFPFTLITYKLPFHSHARTAVDPWLMEILPENYVLINAADAGKLGIKTGDKIRLISPTNQKGEVGKAKVVQGIRPGVVAVSGHYGHWASGALPQVVDGQETGYDAGRGTGINPNPVMRIDTSIGNVGIEDPIGGSAAFYGKVKVVKA
ncbi:molybdopterin-dependent oxidoreductase [Calderihabitans maritimus]|uniref:Molybdopterin oxidoreductase n=1 Tax=Calderihabitans maritimus TaxID=1246530 RepID=A0A1Z5HPE1_9FIRM|nr:molybdopterin-dependent oxidoreductase [Calderihabitans maritimus]GAW91247.1 molybdopterin oxidoreductase [Calderihabitans maritimus]